MHIPELGVLFECHKIMLLVTILERNKYEIDEEVIVGGGLQCLRLFHLYWSFAIFLIQNVLATNKLE